MKISTSGKYIPILAATFKNILIS